jgi:hypothetical protein
MPFKLQGSSSVLMRVMNSAMTRGLRSSDPAPPGAGGLPGTLPPDQAGVPGARGPLHRSVVVYMDDLLCYSSTLKKHLHDSRIFRMCGKSSQFSAKKSSTSNLTVEASKCEFGRQELGFLAYADMSRVD